MSIRVQIDDLSSPEAQQLITEHLSGMHSNSPAGSVHALALQSLRSPDVSFWTAWMGGALCGCGALKQLDSVSGEIKSMRTRSAYLKQGVAQAVLDEILRTAAQRGYARLYLETGTGPAFDAAHALYCRNGFDWCGPFADYTATDFNVFMVKVLADKKGMAQAEGGPWPAEQSSRNDGMAGRGPPYNVWEPQSGASRPPLT